MSEVNAAERRRWNDEAWTASWPKRERLTDEVTASLLDAAALRVGERVVDIGCGGGKTTIAAAGAVAGEGKVVGADVSEALLALAQRRLDEAGLANVELALVDAQVDDIAGAPFDVAISQFGVMFFDEPQTAFANIRRQLRAGGRIAFAVWQPLERNPWFFAPELGDLVPPPPEPAPGKSRTGPFVLGDAGRTTQMFEDAGFGDVRLAQHDLEIETPVDTVFDEAQLRFMGVAEDRLGEAAEKATGYLQQFDAGGDRLRLPIAFQIVTATS